MRGRTPDSADRVVKQRFATTWGGTTIGIALGDITEAEVDVVVNAANPTLLGGGGVDGAIHAAAGPGLLAACRRIVAESGRCPPGEAVITHGGDLPADHVVHTVGPIWSGDRPEEHDRLLARCYSESLRLAEGVAATSIAFPNISTGVYGFPKPRAATVAIDAVRRHVAAGTTLGEIVFVCFGTDNLELYLGALGADP